MYSNRCLCYFDCLLFLSDPSPIIGNACHSLTNSLPFSKLDWCDPGVWRCQLKTCWGLLLLLMLMMRIVLATVWCILGSSGKIFKLEFGHYFASDILQRLRSWILIEMLKLGSVNILNFKFSRDGDVWLRFWSKCLVEILKMKFDQDLCLNLWYDPIGYFGKMNSTLGSVVPLAMFIFLTLLRTILHLITYY